MDLVAPWAAPVGGGLSLALCSGAGVPLDKVAPAGGPIQGAPPVMGAGEDHMGRAC